MGAWNLIKNVILTPVLLLIGLVTGNFSKLRDDALNIWKNILSAASSAWSSLQQSVANIAAKFFDTETLEVKAAEMYITGYKAKLEKDTSCKRL